MAKRMSFKTAYHSPFDIYSVFSGQKCYRLAWLLNNGAGCGFTKLDDFRYPYHEPAAKAFALYGYYNSSFRMHVFLIENHSNGGDRLVPGSPPIDYLLVFANLASIFNLKAFLKNIRSLHEIQAVSQLSPKLSEKHADVFYDLELYLTAIKYM